MLYFKIVFFLCALSTLSAGNVYFFNNYPLTLLPVHITILVSIFSCCVACSLMSSAVIRNAACITVNSLIFAIPTTALMFVYLANAVSNYFWRANINFNLVTRIVTHYFSIYAVETIAVVGSVMFLAVFFVTIIFRRIFWVGQTSVRRPFLAGFCCAALTILLLIQLGAYSVEQSRGRMRQYFAGEMFIDLFAEYTDPHQDYIADAGSIKDVVVQTKNFIQQTIDKIDRTKKNVVVVIIDCLRADHLLSYGYDRNTTPFINNFIEKYKTSQIENTFSICDESKCGIRSLLTSRGLNQQNLSTASQNSLHRVLSDSGYQINFLLTSDHAFGGLKRIYSPYDFYLDGTGFGDYPLNDDRGILSALEEWPDYNGSPNYFHFHLFSAHEAAIKYGKFLGEGVHGIESGFLKGDPINPRFSTVAPSKSQVNIDVMDNKIYQSDLVFSRIYELLDEKGYLDNALVILTGDHGQGLGEHGYFGHIRGLYNESLRVPLIITDTSGGDLQIKESSYATQFDIAPTILSLLNISAPGSWDGLALQKEKTEVTITTHRIPDRSNSYAKTLYNPADNSLFKYIFMSTLNGMQERRFLYDLNADPGERNNLLEVSKGKERYQSLISDWGLDVVNP